MNTFLKSLRKPKGLTLVIGATGKTGRRISARLALKGVPVRLGSRAATPAFDWTNETSWDACLTGVTAVYVSYASDLAIPGAANTIQALVNRAGHHGVQRLVLLTGRGEEEALASERVVQDSGLDWTVIRSAWFNQNFSEGAFADMVEAGQISLPAADTPDPFVDVDDIADVAVAALTERGHAGEIYEVTGPRLMTFADVAADLSRAIGREVAYIPIPHAPFLEGVRESGAPEQVVWLMDFLFGTILDGRNAHIADGVQRALGREPKDFAQYAIEAAMAGAWRKAA